MANFLQFINPFYWTKRRQLIKNPNGLKHFGENCLTDFKRTAINACNRMERKIKGLEDSRKKMAERKALIEKEDVILDRNDFHSVAGDIHKFTFAFWVLLFGETGLNLFTTMVFMPPSENKGLIFWLFRFFIAFAITYMSYLGAHIVFKELLPKRKYHPTRTTEASVAASVRGSYSSQIAFSHLIVGSVTLIAAEFLIYFLGLVRVRDLVGANLDMGGNSVDKNLAIALILLSMILPLGIAYVKHEIDVSIDAYKNRLILDSLTAKLHGIENEIVEQKTAMNAVIEEEIDGRWATFNTFRVSKENFNAKRSPPIQEDLSQYPYFDRNEHSAFRQECLKRWFDAIAQHPDGGTSAALKTLMDKMISPLERTNKQTS
jgi:hypothetical protein